MLDAGICTGRKAHDRFSGWTEFDDFDLGGVYARSLRGIWKKIVVGWMPGIHPLRKIARQLFFFARRLM